MCLGIPGKIIEIYDKNELKMGKVDFGGVVRESCLAYVPEANTGDFVLVHVGFALNVISEKEANETMEILRKIADIDAELNTKSN